MTHRPQPLFTDEQIRMLVAAVQRLATDPDVPADVQSEARKVAHAYRIPLRFGDDE